MSRIVLSICALLVLIGPTFAAKNSKALLIGVEGYEKVSPLKYVSNDVRRLAESLSDRCGFEVTHVIDTSVDERVQEIGPTTHRDALMKTIESWSVNMAKTDTAILYFSGHGFIGRDGKLYLASLNCDANNPLLGGIPASWLREQLSKCSAQCKVLLLDACHAGTSKDFGNAQATAKAIEVELQKIPDVVTLASCRGNQRSILWNGKHQSLFTYWLAEAAKGHADRDANGWVSIDELTEYVQRNVVRTAKVLDHEQNPVLLGGDKVRESLKLVPKAISLKRLIMDMAEKIDTQMRQKKLLVVGVPEFASNESGDLLGIKHGTLPAYISNELTDELAVLADGDYEVISGPALNKELIRRQIDVGNLETSELSDFKVGTTSVSVLAIGRIRGREGALFRLGCKLKKSGSAGQLGSANGICFLNESEWAMLGRSASMSTAPIRSETTPPLLSQVQLLDLHSQRLHPLLDPNFPFTVEIRVKDSNGEFKKRDGRVKENDYYVTLRRGEIYRIHITDRLTRGVFLRLLVDGLNTLPQKSNLQIKGITVEPTEGESELRVAPRVNLAEARAWYLDPATIDATGRIKPASYSIGGFFKEMGSNDAYDEFVVTDAPNSVAGRKKYTQQIGLITAAFYWPTSPRILGTKQGKEYKQHLKHYKGGKVPGDLMGVIHIRYGESE